MVHASIYILYVNDILFLFYNFIGYPEDELLSNQNINEQAGNDSFHSTATISNQGS